MSYYRYKAKDQNGACVEGLRQAASQQGVFTWLNGNGFTPISITMMSGSIKEARPINRKKRIKSAELAALCWQLSTMVKGGISILHALETSATDCDNTRLQEILKKAIVNVKNGVRFSDSIAEFPDVFNSISHAIILAGETSGDLPLALHRLAGYFDNRDKLAKKVHGAMAYPIFALGFIIVIVICIMTFVLPRFAVMFEQMGTKLPVFTKIFLQFYDMVRLHAFYIIGVFLVLIVSAFILGKTRKGFHLYCRIALGLPLFGKILHQNFIASFCKTMSALLSSGVSVLEVFDILSTMTNNIIDSDTSCQEQYHRGFERLIGHVRIGVFPKYARQNSTGRRTERFTV